MGRINKAAQEQQNYLNQFKPHSEEWNYWDNRICELDTELENATKALEADPNNKGCQDRFKAAKAEVSKIWTPCVDMEIRQELAERFTEEIRADKAQYNVAMSKVMGCKADEVDAILNQRAIENIKNDAQKNDKVFNGKQAFSQRSANANQFKAVLADNKQALVDVLSGRLLDGTGDDTIDSALDQFKSNVKILGMLKITVGGADDPTLEKIKTAFGVTGDIGTKTNDGKLSISLADLMLGAPNEDSYTKVGLFSLDTGWRPMREGLEERLRAMNDFPEELKDVAETIRNTIAAAVDAFAASELSLFDIGTINLAMDKVQGEITGKLNAMQKDIETQIDETFKSPPNVKSFGAMDLNEMMDDAMKPSDGGYTTFLKELLKGYFKEMPLVSKLKMASAGIRYGKTGGTEAENLGAVLKGAGPLLQKILQGLDEGQLGNTDLAKAIKDMKSHLAPIPKDVVQAHLLDIVNRSGGSITKLEVTKTLGCASVAQAVLCKAYGPGDTEGREVVVKIVRPDALQGIRREKDFVMEIARKTKMGESYAGHIATILEEFDFIHEAENIKVGEVYDKGQPRVQSVKTLPIVETAPGTLIMERAPGDTVENFVETSKKTVEELRQKITMAKSGTERAEAVAKLKSHYDDLLKCQKDLCNLSAKWVTEGLYGRGVFHGDLHAGNIMMDADKGVTLIDFGNITQLTQEEQDAITQVATAASGPGSQCDVCTDYFLQGFKRLLHSKDARDMLDTDAVKERISSVLSRGSGEDAGKRILIAITQLQRMGVDIPAPIFKFSQSQMRLQNTVDSFNAHLDEIKNTFGMLDDIRVDGGDSYGDSIGLLSQYKTVRQSMDKDKNDQIKAFVKDLANPDSDLQKKEVLQVAKNLKPVFEGWRQWSPSYGHENEAKPTLQAWLKEQGVMGDIDFVRPSVEPEGGVEKLLHDIEAKLSEGSQLKFPICRKLAGNMADLTEKIKESLEVAGKKNVDATECARQALKTLDDRLDQAKMNKHPFGDREMRIELGKLHAEYIGKYESDDEAELSMQCLVETLQQTFDNGLSAIGRQYNEWLEAQPQGFFAPRPDEKAFDCSELETTPDFYTEKTNADKGIDDLVDDLAKVMVDAECKELSKAIKANAEIKESPQLKAHNQGLDTFVDCMGKVVLQNLVATKKRLDFKLIKIVS